MRVERGPLTLLLLFLLLPSAARAAADAGSSLTNSAWKRAYLLSRAGAFFAEGKWADARRIFDEVLKADPINHVALMHLAAISHRLDDHPGALPYLRRAAAAHPKSFEARNELGQWLLALGHPEEAVPQLAAAAALQPDSLDTRVGWGDALSRMGKKREAVEVYGAALDRKADHAPALRQRGYVLFELREFAAASEDLSHADTLSPDPHVALTRGHCHFELGNDAVASLVYQEVLRRAPRLAAAHLAQGRVLERMHKPREAERAFVRATELAPDDPVAFVHLGNLLRKENRSSEAKAAFERALAVGPSFVWAMVQLGFLLFEQGQHAGAKALLDRALSLEPFNPEVATALGDLAALAERFPEAERYFRRALLVRDNHLSARVKLGDVVLRRSPSEARTHYLAAIKAHPASAWALIRLGDCEQQLGDLPGAEKRYRAALGVEPGSGWARRQLAFLLAGLRRDPEALAALSSLEGAAHDGEVQLALGHILRRQRKEKEAREHYERAVALLPRSARAQLSLGEVLRSANELEAALRRFQAALELDGKLVEAWVLQGDTHRLIARALPRTREGDQTRARLEAKARRSYEGALAIEPTLPWVKRQLGLLAFDTADLDVAERLVGEARPSFPADPELELTVGRIALLRGQCPRAIEAFARAQELMPKDPRPLVFAAECHRLSEAPERALPLLEEAARLDARSGWALLQLATVQADLGDVQHAAENASRAVALDPYSKEGWLLLGRLEEASRHFDRAVQAYDAALKLAPDQPDILRACASARLNRRQPGDLEAAAKLIRPVISSLEGEAYTHLVAGNVEALLLQALFLRVEGNPKVPGLADHKARALYHLRRALALSGEELSTRATVAQGLFDLGELDEVTYVLAPLHDRLAARCAAGERGLRWEVPPAKNEELETRARRQELAEARLLSRAAVLRGDVASQRQRELDARQSYACALSHWPRNADAHLRLGFSYERAGLIRLAEEHYVTALGFAPESRTAEEGIARVRNEAGVAFGPLRAWSELRFQSDVQPVEVNAVLAQRAEVFDLLSQREIGTVPRAASLVVGGAYAPARFHEALRIEGDYGLVRGFGTLLDAQRLAVDTLGHRLGLGLRGRVPQLLERRAELTWVGRYGLATDDGAALGSTRHRFEGGLRLVQLNWGAAEALLAYERGLFRAVAPAVLAESAMNAFSWELRGLPVVRPFQLEGSLAYRGQLLRFAPTGRNDWRHALTAEARRWRGQWTFGGLLRVALASGSSEDLPEVPTALFFGTGLGARVGYALAGLNQLSGLVRLDNAWGSPAFDALTPGLEGSYRLLDLSRLFGHAPHEVGLGLTLSAQLRYRYNLQQVDPLVSATLGLAR